MTFNEDKFSVLLTTSNVDLAGDRTFHASPHPVADAPATMTGRGLHFTAAGMLCRCLAVEGDQRRDRLDG